ncbi:MAG: glycerol dehydratase reactivase beta/small subunit family protein [Vibrio sp.]
MSVAHLEIPPHIAVYHAQSADMAQWQPVLHGMEEEGIPYQVSQKQEVGVSAAQTAYQAAQLSPLGVGVFCDRNEIIVHNKNLPQDHPLFTVQLSANTTEQELRHLGCNAARLVKGLPFISNQDGWQ